MFRILELILFLNCFISLGYTRDSVTALCYHTFISNSSLPYDFSPDEFSKQIDTLKSLGYQFVSFQDIISNKVKGQLNILITIDDGNKSIHRIFDSVLLSNHIKPIVFIYPNIIGRIHYAARFNDLEEWMKKGTTIGAHGYYHLLVTQKLFDKDPSGFIKEINKAKEVLENKLKLPINLYSYPFGVYSPITIEYLIKANYQYAFTIKPGVIQLPLATYPKPYELPRYLVTRNEWFAILKILEKSASNYHNKEK